MYQRYAEARRWKFELMSVSETGLGGVKEAVGSVGGRGVYARLKYESGVHRVQRVPETEASGRIHTSAATVAVLPEAGDVDVAVDEKELRIDVYRSSGPGRPERQHDGQRGAHHASADGNRGHPTGREIAAQEQGQGDEGAARATLRSGARAPGGRTRRRAARPDRLRRSLRAYPHLQLPAGAGERPPHRPYPAQD